MGSDPQPPKPPSSNRIITRIDGNSVLNFLFDFGITVLSGIVIYSLGRYIQQLLFDSYPNRNMSKKLAMMLKRPELEGLELGSYEAELASTTVVSSDNITGSFDDIGGLDDVLSDVRDNVILPFLMWKCNPYDKSLQHPTGVLLYGNPGTGKSLTAKALAKEIDAAFLQVNASNLLDKYIGETEKRVVALFSLARKIAPCVLFIDEIDSMVRSRDSSNSSNGNMRNFQSLLLSEWDGLSSSDSPVIVLGATNRVADIDDAFLRRMPVQINVPSPNVDAREDILKKMLRDVFVGELNTRDIAERTENFSGSDLRELVRLANLSRMKSALRRTKDGINQLEQNSNGSNDNEKFTRYSQHNITAVASVSQTRALVMEDFEFALSRCQLKEAKVDNYNRSVKEDTLMKFLKTLSGN